MPRIMQSDRSDKFFDFVVKQNSPNENFFPFRLVYAYLTDLMA